MSLLGANSPLHRGYLDLPTRYPLQPGVPIDHEMALHYARALGIDVNAPIFIGGGGETYLQNPGIVQTYVGDRGSGNYYRHYQADRVYSAMEVMWALGKPIIIIGHSWGGDRAIEAAFRALRRGMPVAMLVTADPITGAGGRGMFGPENHSPSDYARLSRELGGVWVNIPATAYRRAPDTSDTIARVGGRLRSEDAGRADVSIPADVHHFDFRGMMRGGQVEQMISTIYYNHQVRRR